MEKNSLSVCVNEKDEIDDTGNSEQHKLPLGWWTIAERQKGVMVIHKKIPMGTLTSSDNSKKYPFYQNNTSAM